MNGDIKYCSHLNKDFSERVSYNHPCFPVYARYDVLSGYPDYSAVSHWHEDLEFILIKKGKMTYNVNGELLELSEKKGIMYDATIVMEDTGGKYVNFRLEFGKKK